MCSCACMGREPHRQIEEYSIENRLYQWRDSWDNLTGRGGGCIVACDGLSPSGRFVVYPLHSCRPLLRSSRL